MKILFIISSLSSGGAERVLTTLANHWTKKGWDIEIFSLSSEKMFYKVDSNIKIYSSRNYYQNSTLNYLRQLLDIRKTAQISQPDIIISFLNLMNISTLISTIGLKTPVIISERNNFDTLKSKFWRALRRITYPHSKGMVVLSQYDFDQYTYVKSKKIIINPLDMNKLLDVNIQDKENLIIAVGSLSTKQKGFDMLIEALSSVEIKNWKVMIIGEGKERENLEALIHKYQLQDSVLLIGRKDNVFDYYKRASIFVLSSRYEGFPNVLNEAMAHGCACVAFNCKTGPSEMIENHINGFLVEANNTNSLSKKISTLIDKQALRESFSEEAMKIRKKNNLEKISLQWETYIKNIKEFYV